MMCLCINLSASLDYIWNPCKLFKKKYIFWGTPANHLERDMYGDWLTINHVESSRSKPLATLEVGQGHQQTKQSKILLRCICLFILKYICSLGMWLCWWEQQSWWEQRPWWEKHSWWERWFWWKQQSWWEQRPWCVPRKWCDVLGPLVVQQCVHCHTSPPRTFRLPYYLVISGELL